jgi:hypothetical protein
MALSLPDEPLMGSSQQLERLDGLRVADWT